MSLAKVIDNKRVLLKEVLNDIAGKYDTASIAVGYWDLPGLLLVWDKLKNYKKVRLLIGREPLLKRDNSKNISAPEPDFPDDDFFKDLRNLNFSPELQNVIKELYEKIKKGEFEVKVYRRDFLHAKAYIFGDYSSQTAVAIVGSSNFTEAGLTSNTELNTTESDHRIVLFKPDNKNQEHGYLSWFDELWNDEKAEEWSGEFIELVRTSPTGDLLYSPYELYIRAVYELYKHIFEAEEKSKEEAKVGSFELTEFQKRNVKNIKYILDKYGVAMLADSVGLGKTVSAAGVIKENDPRSRVVIIAPAALKDQWRQELMKGHIQNATVISLQDKGEIERQMELDKFVPVTLFVIDESHNLRNSNSKRYELISNWIASDANENSDVLLLTATPINNSLDDLINQILLGARGEQDILILPTIDRNSGEVVLRSFYEIVENTKKRIGQVKKKLENKGADEDEIKEELKKIYEEARMVIDPVIRSFVIRNTRQSIKEQGEDIHFPDININNIEYEIPDLGGHNFSSLSKTIFSHSLDSLRDAMDLAMHPLRQIENSLIKQADLKDKENISMLDIYKIVLSLGLVPYRWRIYDSRIYKKPRKEISDILKGQEKTKLLLQWSAYGMIRTQLLKRLESSPYALQKSLERYLNKLSVFKHFLSEKDLIIPLSDISETVNDFDSENDKDKEISVQEIEKNIKEGKIKPIKNASERYHTNIIKEDIEKEESVIQNLLTISEYLINEDNKLKAFKELLRNEHKNNPNKKILIFSSYSDTIDYLKSALLNDSSLAFLKETAEFVSGKDKNHALKSANRFAPEARKYTLKDEEAELTYLFSTDVLSEGQNLQDAQAIVNYDLHWNPVRMIQRNGRINRIGSKHKEIFVTNYIPNQDLDNLLRLVKTIEDKIELMRITVGTDTQVLNEEIDPRAYSGIYSPDSDKAIKEYYELEEKLESLSDDIFIKDIREFIKTTPEKEVKKTLRISDNSWTKGDFDIDKKSTITMSKVFMKEEYPDEYSDKLREEELKKEIFLEVFVDEDNPKVVKLVQTQALNKLRNFALQHKNKPVNDIDEKYRENFREYFDRFAKDAAREPRREETLTELKLRIKSIAEQEFNFTQEELDKLEDLLVTRNILLRRKVSRLARRINYNIQNEISYEKEFEELKELSEKAKQIPEREIDKVVPMFLFKQE